jgi:hypothetical protein
MTPKEKKLIQLFYPNVQWKLGQEDCLDRAIRCVEIADEFAIDFGQWLLNQPYRVKYNDKKELLEIYKETL